MQDTAQSDDDRDDAQADRDQEILRRACMFVVGNNFDAVQIIATRHDGEDGSVLSAKGLGNYYARVGAVQQWCEAVKKDSP